jgi:hypothetical protein
VTDQERYTNAPAAEQTRFIDLLAGEVAGMSWNPRRSRLDRTGDLSFMTTSAAEYGSKVAIRRVRRGSHRTLTPGVTHHVASPYGGRNVVAPFSLSSRTKLSHIW